MRFRVNDLHFMIYKRIKVRSLTVRCITISSQKKVALEREDKIHKRLFVRTLMSILLFSILYNPAWTHATTTHTTTVIWFS